MIPGNGVGERISLVEFAPRRRVAAQAAKRSEADSRQAIVKRVCGNSGDAGEAVNICYARVEICRGRVIVVVIHTQIVGRPAFAVDPAGAGIQALSTVATGQGRKRIHNAARTARPVQAEIEIVLRAAASPATPAAPDDDWPASSGARGGAEVVDRAEYHGIGAAVRRSHVMEVLPEG